MTIEKKILQKRKKRESKELELQEEHTGSIKKQRRQNKMALKKVAEGTKDVTIDKVIGKSKNGIEVNGQAYWFSKKSGLSVAYEAGEKVQLSYTHLVDSESGDNVFMIADLDNTSSDKDKMLDQAIGEHVSEFDAKVPNGIPTLNNKQPLEKDEKITNMNILNRAVDYCIATGNLSDADILERCKRFKDMLSEF
jgi:hypothetical protein